MIEQAVRDFLMLFATIDPVATLALFVPLTRAVPGGRRRVAVRAVLYAGLVLMGFLVAGQFLLASLGVRLVSFQLAGGVILFLLGLQMVFGTGIAAHGPQTETGANGDSGDAEGADGHDVAVFPLALPSIASPGAIAAVVVLTDNHRQSVAEQSLTAAMLVVVLAMTLVLLLLAEPIYRVIGRTGSSVLVRVMGLILCSLAAEQVVAAIELIVSAAR
jgi:multiple antibiotic resistance protein